MDIDRAIARIARETQEACDHLEHQKACIVAAHDQAKNIVASSSYTVLILEASGRERIIDASGIHGRPNGSNARREFLRYAGFGYPTWVEDSATGRIVAEANC